MSNYLFNLVLPNIILDPIAGVVADRISRKTLLSLFVHSISLFLLSQSVSIINTLIYIMITGFYLSMFNLQSMALFQTYTLSNIRGRE